MASMCDAAMDESEFQAVMKELVDNDLVIESAAALGPPGDKPLAWSVTARRQ
jgi:hypothetical protein